MPTWRHAATLFFWTPFGDSKQLWGCRERDPLSERDSFLVPDACHLYRREVHSNGPVWDDDVLADAEIQDAIQNSGMVDREYDITNVQRSALGRIGGAVARLHGDRGFAGSLNFVLSGSGGQSFGCFMVSYPMSW